MDRSARLERMLDNWSQLDNKRKQQTMDESEDDSMRTLTVSEVAELLALAEQTIRRKLRAGEIPGVQTGKGWRISRADLEEWWGEQGGETLFDDDDEEVETRNGFQLTSESKHGWGHVADDSGVDELRDLQPGARVQCQPLEGGGWLLARVPPDGTNDTIGGEVLAKVPPEESEYFEPKSRSVADMCSSVDREEDTDGS